MNIDRITFDENIDGGKACIIGMRIPVSIILGLIAQGMSWETIIEEYPDLEYEDIRQVLYYAAWFASEEHYSFRDVA